MRQCVQPVAPWLSEILHHIRMTLTGFFKRLIGKSASDQSTRATPALANYARKPQLMSYAPAQEAIGVWTPRGDGFWNEQTARDIKHLRNDWSTFPDRGRWPDASELLTLLSATRDARHRPGQLR